MIYLEFQEATRVKELIDCRILVQKGQFKPAERALKIGISTSILSIHNILVGFFQFYINHYKDEFLSLINMPFGYSVHQRLRALSGVALPEEVEEDENGVLFGMQEIIDDDKI